MAIQVTLRATRHWTGIAAILLVLLLGTWLRFHAIGDKVLWYDELYSALWYSGHDLAAAKPALAGRALRPNELTAVLRLDEGSDYRGVIDVIIRDDPQHSPLYFLALRAWAGLAGDSLGTLRSLSAVADILLLPLLFWLCMELSGSRKVAWLAVALAAVSPFHIVYSQELRQYTLWTLLTVASSAWMLRTLRSPSAWKWLVYGLAVTAGLYTHLLFCLVVFTHAAYLGSAFLLERSGPPGSAVRNLLGWGLATAGSLLLFSPWAWVILTHFSRAAARVSWLETDVGWLHLVAMWGSNYSAVFLDTNHVLKFLHEPGPLVYVAFATRALILVPVAFAVLALLRDPRPRGHLFVLALILVPFLALGLPDLLFGGVRSAWGNRYMAPSYLGVEIALAWWLAGRVGAGSPAHARIRTGMLAVFLAAGVFSGVLYARSDTWWHKSIGYYNGEIARIVNAEVRPLVVSPSVTDLLTLSVSLADHVTVKYAENSPRPDSLASFSAVFVLSPGDALRSGSSEDWGAGLEPVLPRAELYRLRVP